MKNETFEPTLPRTVVLGLGNLLYGDEGLGIHALNQLKDRVGEQSQVEFVDGGVLGLNLLPLVEETSYLLVLDAIDMALTPGTPIEIDKEKLPLFAKIKLSEHQVGFQEVLGMANFRGKLPERIQVIGVQPSSLDTGIDLSPVVEDRLPWMVQRSIEILREWGK